MLRIAQMKSHLQSKGIGTGIVAASGVLLVAAVAFSLWALSRSGSSDAPQVGIVVFEVSVPREIPLSEHYSGSTGDGAPLEMSGSTAFLRFQEGFLEAMDLPIRYSPDHQLASFSDAAAGIYLEQNGTEQPTLHFPLHSNQGGMPLTITGAVESIQPQGQGAQTRISLGRMEASAEFPTVLAPDSGLPSIESVRLTFEVRRLPKDARLMVSRLEGVDRSTRSAIDSTLDEGLGSWTVVLALEVRRTNLDNGGDVGEAALYLTLSDMGQESMENLVVVHVDDEGRVERLAQEVVSTRDGEAVARFLSPGGLSIFAVMVPGSGLEATPTPAPTATATIPTATPTALPPATSPPTGAATATPVPTFTPTPTTLSRPTPTSSPTPVATLLPSPTPTTTLLPSPSPTATPPLPPTPTTTLLPSPSPTATPPLPPTPTPVPTETPALTPSPTFTPTSTLMWTPTPSPTPQPTSTALPTSTSMPIPVPDEHYAVIVHTQDLSRQQWFLDTLRTNWFLDFTSPVDAIPNGHKKLVYIGDLPGPTPQRVQEIAQQAPGSVWYIVGEPNRRAGYGAGGIVTQLHDLYTEIKTADPTAKITSPSVLNWEFTCNGCGGFQKGSSWVNEFRTAYLAQYGTEPPVDIWAIDVYPLDWWNLPTVDHQLAIAQIDGLRQYLNTIPAQQSKPIWITELGLHWGWDKMLFPGDEGYDSSCGGLPQPAGTYQTQQVIGYLDAIFDWLDANAASKNIEKWFLLTTYENINRCNSSAYAGLTLFDAAGVGANLTPVGQFFRDRVMGISR